ncbi:MAG: PIG-L family deacetylase [Polyangia bacterium]
MKHRIIRHACLTLALTGLAACGGGEGATKTDAGPGDARSDGDAGSLAGAGGRGGGGGGSGHGGTGGSFISSGGSGGPVAGADGGVTTDGPGGTPGTGGGVTSSGGSGASGGIPASGGAGGSGAGTGGTPGTGGGAIATGGSAMGTGGSAATGGRVGSGGTSATGGRAGTGGAVSTGGAAVTTGGAPGSGGAPGTGGAATGGAGTGGAATGGRGTGGAGTGGAGTGGAATGGAGTGGAGTGGAATGGAGTGGAGTGGAAGATTASVYVVAHPDDELLFMNPDLKADIFAGKAVTTVYVTSGDGQNGLTQATAREASVRKAHAAMAGLANPTEGDWSCAMANYGGKSPRRCVLTAHPSVRAIYLRILDGKVPDVITGTANTIDSSTTYTGAQLTDVLTAILAEVQPGKVGVLDASQVHGSDHPDHVASARFAFDVGRADGVVRELTMYRGYSMAEPSFATAPLPAAESPNLSPAQYDEKSQIVQVYQPTPQPDPDFDLWCHRMYPLKSLTGGPAPLHTAGGQCLQTGATSGSAVSVATCNGAAAQNWTVTSTGRVLDSTGKCLGVVGAGVVVETCDASADERWSLLSDGELKGPTDQCAQVSGTAVTSSTCTSDMAQPLFRQVTSQRWNF